jgi:transcriptional regulator with XRE-family HTH domain
MSQEKLGKAIGLTFQQVQKYERGANRLVVSRLHELRRVLDVSISFFFDDTASRAARLIGTPRQRTISAREVSHGRSNEPD